MSNPILHIVSFDVPYPADYGGVIDIYHRLKALNKLGVSIHLHCFEYGRPPSKKLEELTEAIYYYRRKRSFLDVFSSIPFIVKSRRTEKLLHNLLNVDAPILFEGLHTTFFLSDERLINRVKLVRSHNVEHDYYEQLSQTMTGWRKWFHTKEAGKLKRYESILKYANHILAIKESDASHFRTFHPSVHILPAAFETLKTKEKQNTTPYTLFQGNLSVGENEQAVLWLLDHVFPIEGITLKIAGKNPSPHLQRVLTASGVELIENPPQKTMNQLIENARVHVLPTQQSTGVKLKLIHALQHSGHVLVNDRMIAGTKLHSVCHVMKSPDEWKRMITRCMQIELSDDEYNSRQSFLQSHFNTLTNSQKIIDLI